MNTKTRWGVLLSGVALAACGIIGPSYPKFGSTPFRIEGVTMPASGGAGVRTVIYRDGARLRVETVLPGRGPAVVVYDEATNSPYVLNSVAQIVNNVPAVSAGPGAAATGTTAPVAPAQSIPTPTQPNVIGVAVRIPDADAPQPLETAWAALGASGAQSVGACRVANEAGNEWRARSTPHGVAERTACITSDGIVLRVTDGGRAVFQATALQRGPINPSLFGVPAGYQKVDPAVVADGVDQTVGRLDSVTAQTPTTQPAPPPG